MTIDWTAHDEFPENTITCACGTVFRSHSKWTADRGIATRKPCPGCARCDHMRQASSDPERVALVRSSR